MSKNNESTLRAGIISVLFKADVKYLAHSGHSFIQNHPQGGLLVAGPVAPTPVAQPETPSRLSPGTWWASGKAGPAAPEEKAGGVGARAAALG